MGPDDRTRRGSRQLDPLLALCALCLLFTGSPARSAEDDLHSFSIPPQQLTTALLEFARQARVSIGFPDDLTDGLQSPGADGLMSRQQALTLLLADTGLSYAKFGQDVIRVSSDVAPPAIDANDVSARSIDPSIDLVTAFALPSQAQMEEIVTIGSQIRNARVSGMLPVTVMDRPRIDVVGATSGGELFRTLPAADLVNFNGIDNYFYGVNDARGDVASVNLRGLGSGNTLMLLNGRRMVTHPGVQTEDRVLATTVNSNVMPVSGIARIEVLRDGASSIYGSEAVGGVINTILRNDVEGLRIDLHHGAAEASSMDESLLELQFGTALGGKGRLSVFASLLQRDGMPASEREYSRSSDLRPLFAGTRFADDTDLNNTAASSAWGQFNLGQVVSRNGQPITSDTGLLHIQPASFEGCLASLSAELCVDDGVIDDELRFDSNAYRYLAPDLLRRNLFAMLNYDLTDNLELFGELGWYDAESENTREPASPLSSHPLTIPANNYWNPFGPVTFADGRANPNRLDGIDAPPEGLPILINTRVLGSFYRVADAGPRRVVVDNDSQRLLAGLRGQRGHWNWESALLYSKATTVDTTHRRVSSSLFQQSLALDTAEAYNAFNGGDPATLRYGDGTPNPKSTIDSFLLNVARYNETSLALMDIQLSNAELTQSWAGPVGIGLGFEFRRERFAEDRDPRLDGTVGFTDIVSGESYESDILQSSATPDSSGSRSAYSLFAELALPLVDEAMQIPWAQRIDLQLALRLERFSDVGEEIRPRAALSWQLNPQIQVRGAWSQGFRAPNLPQVNAGPVPRLQVVRDWYRCRALVNKGLSPSLGDCTGEDVRATEVITSGSSNLSAEDTENTSLGIVLRSPDDGRLTLTADYWSVTQNGVVGLFGEQNHVALDYALRLTGSDNAAVTRAPLRQEDIDLFAGSGLAPVGLLTEVRDIYLNLDRRVTRGVDIALYYDWQTARSGKLRLTLEGSRLLSVDQAISTLGQAIAGLDEPAIPVVGAGSLLELNGRPLWRAAIGLDWKWNKLNAGFLARYVGKVRDTSAIHDESQEFLPVDAWTTMNAYADYALPAAFGDDALFRFGVRNIFNRAPPVADESLGYFVGLHESTGRYWYLGFSTGIDIDGQR